MTDSRVEAVARAICVAEGVDPEHECIGLGKLIPQGETWPAWKVRLTQAQAAIEANDKWLAVKWTCPNCEAKHNQDAKDCWLCQTKREPDR